jgi:hypothetical protein
VSFEALNLKVAEANQQNKMMFECKEEETLKVMIFEILCNKKLCGFC